MGNGLINLSDIDMNDIIKSIIVNNSVAVSLVGTGRDNDVLTNSITSALKTYYNSIKKGEKEHQEEQTDEIVTAINEQTEVVKEQIIVAKKRNKTVDIIKEIEKEKKSWDKAQLQRIAKILGEVALNTGKKMYDETKLRFKWLRELESAGIRLSGGFDESFTKLANSAKLSHDSLMKMIQDNKKSFSSMNALGKDAVEKLMKASGDIAGKYGLSAEEAFKLTMYYSDQLGSRMSREEMQNMKLDNQIDVLAKDMKALSIATGKSVEQLIAERKEREKTILMKKINRDPKMAAIFEVGKQMGLDEDVLLSAITGIPNEKSSLMHTNKATAFLFNGIKNIVQDRRIKSAEDVAAAYSKIQKNPIISEGAKEILSKDPAMLGVISGTELNSRWMELVDFSESIIPEVKSDKESTDEKALNAFTNTQSELNKISNTMNKKMAVPLETATKGLNLFNTALSKTNDILENISDGWVKAGYAAFYSSPTARKIASNWVADFFNPFKDNNYEEDEKPSFLKRLFGFKNNDGDGSSTSSKLSIIVRLLSALTGTVLAFYGGDIANSMVDKNKNPGLFLSTDSAIKGVTGALLGYGIFGNKYVGIAGGIAGVGLGLFGDDSDKPIDIPNKTYPAHNKETQYGNSGSTKSNIENKNASTDYMYDYLSKNDEVVSILKNISTYTSALPKMYKEQQFSSNGSIIP